jgi:DNA uptake protein ComE-like DNA-binding protein
MLNRLTASQKRGALLLLGALVLVIGWRWRVAWLDAQKLPPQNLTTQNAGPNGSSPGQSISPAKEIVRVELNTADTATLQQVKGIGPSYARRIVTFRETYGGIVDPQQLIDALRLEPDAWLRIEPQVFTDTTSAAFMELKEKAVEKQAYLKSLTAGKNSGRRNYSNNNYNYNSPKVPARTHLGDPVADTKPKSSPKLQAIDINQADSTALVAIPGVGPRTAQEIVKFRNSVFFIHSREQIQTLWCVRPENWERMEKYMLVQGPFDDYAHIPLNTGDVEALAAHKYIRWKDARLIVAYRDQHGPYGSVDDLQKLHGLEKDRIDLIAPYLQF